MIEKRLQDIYKDVSDWLKFAETKNAALITFNSLWLSIFIKMYLEKGKPIILAIPCFILLIPLIVSIISIIPNIFKLNALTCVVKCLVKKPSLDDNLIYYKTIAKYDYIDYLVAVLDKFTSEKNYTLTYFENNLITQIVDVSKVCYGKYLFFNFAMSVNLLIIIFIVAYNLIGKIV